MPSLHYVILRHDGVSEPHFDWMFETYPGSLLSTWRSATWPIATGTTVTRLRDHRRMYLEYEGEIGGHRGFVHRIAEGTCEIDVGENSRWTIHLLTGTSPLTLHLQPIDAEQWEASPA
jgi:hypothetical protein